MEGGGGAALGVAMWAPGRERWRDGHVSTSGGAWSTRKTDGNILLENGKGGEPPREGGAIS